MRLRLTVQRHGLPSVQLLWKVDAVKPSGGAPGTSATISQFLEHVNDIIPLEAEDWGLEDYAVEVHGFECLHFAELSQVLKEDDEVCIRPLQTSDLRFRKFSGRLQIAADGKHLIDGVAFGRPFLKRADRPAVRIMPRKRRRITINEENYYGTRVDDDKQQVVLRAGFDNVGKENPENPENESEDDEDFDPDEDSTEGLSEELEDLQKDLQTDSIGDGGITVAEGTILPVTRSRRKLIGLGLRLSENTAYHNPLLDQYYQDEPFTGPSSLKVRKRQPKGKPTKPGSKGHDQPGPSAQRVSRRDSAESFKSVRFEDVDVAAVATPATVRESVDSDDEDDNDFEPFDESDKENTQPLDNDLRTADSSDSSSSFSEEDEDDDDDSMSLSNYSSSDSDSDSASQPDYIPGSGPIVADGTDSDDMSSSESSSSSSQDSEPQQDKKTKRITQYIRSAYPVTPNTSIDESMMPGTRSIETGKSNKFLKSAEPQAPVPPGQGKAATRKRNVRRKAKAALKRLKAKSDLARDAGTPKLQRNRDGSSNQNAAEATTLNDRKKLNNIGIAEENSVDLASKETRLDAVVTKRDALHSSLYSERGNDIANNDKVGEAVSIASDEEPGTKDEAAKSGHDGNFANSNHFSASDELHEETAISKEHLSSMNVQVPSSMSEDSEARNAQISRAGSMERQVIACTPPDAASTPASVPSGSQRRRTRLDLAGSKRLLFGSLGLKTPKTKEEESALREKLMKDVKPLKEPRAMEIADPETASTPAENEVNWQDKIELAAVECCHDNVELSTPPFPFVQRWDPQQRGTSKKRRKTKKRKRNQQSFYEDESFESGSPAKVARQDDHDVNNEEPQYDKTTFEHDHTHRIQDKPEEDLSTSYNQDSLAANEQLMRETSESAAQAAAYAIEGDLPDLPDDLTTCHFLKQEDCSAGAIVAFKKVDMSASTNWQPKITSYMTAVINEQDENGTLHVTLARRDHAKDNRRYNKESGAREYGKFEMPGYDGEGTDKDYSKLDVFFNELIEPLLIKPAESSHDVGQETQAKGPLEDDRPQDETPLCDDAQRTSAGLQAPMSFDGTMDSPTQFQAETFAPSEAARREIMGMIHDAGWRSSLASGLGKELVVVDDTAASATSGLDEHLTGIRSPTFRTQSLNPQRDDHQDEPVSLPTEIPASQSPNIVRTGNDASEAHGASSGSELRPEDSASKSVVRYPTLPQSNDDHEMFQSQRQHRSMSLESDLQAGPKDFISPPPQRRRHTRPSSIPVTISKKTAKNSPGPVSAPNAGADSSDEFPELFSQAFEARMSQEPIIKDESSQKHDLNDLPRFKSKSKGVLSFSRKSNISTSQKTKRNSTRSQATNWSRFDEEDNDSSSRPSQSQIQQSSQVVDLTISSDPLDSIYDENEGDSSFKSSSGWIDKLKANKIIGLSKKASRRTTRSTS